MSQISPAYQVFDTMCEVWKRGVNLATGVRDVGPEQASSMIRAGAVVLDVREPHEWAKGVVAGSLLIPLAHVEDRQQEIAHLRGHPLVVICHGGKRSATACRILARLGFAKQVNLAGGILAWQHAGLTLDLP